MIEMVKKILCFGITCIFMLINLTAVSAVGKKEIICFLQIFDIEKPYYVFL